VLRVPDGANGSACESVAMGIGGRPAGVRGEGETGRCRAKLAKVAKGKEDFNRGLRGLRGYGI